MPHHRAALLSIGDELALGQSQDTNTRWLADRLAARGVLTVEHVTVPDECGRIAGAFARLMQSVDLIIATGGLGPTADDMTRRALAEALGQPLVEDPDGIRQIEAYFAARGRDMPPINRIQALRPEHGRLLANPNGTAPGLFIPSEGPGCDVFSLPGPPREMQPMFEREVLPRLDPPGLHAIRIRRLHTHGLGESEIATRLGALMERTRCPLVGTTASQAIVTCRIRYEGPVGGERGDSPEKLMDETASLIHERLDPYIFAEEYQSLAGAVVELLRARGRRLAVVESCTGGMLGAMVTQVAGASDVFAGGWITYTNEAKEREVGVPAEIFGPTPEAPGAVSGECALAMAAGGLARSGVHEALAITGIAGPGGGSTDKPVGTVWIALASRADSGAPAMRARRFHFPGDRENIRDWSCKAALGMLRLHLLGRDELPLLGEQR